MANELFNIVFQGKIQPDCELSQVKEQLGRLFNVGDDKLNMMFSGKPVVIKKSADRATAQKFLQAMKKAGAVAHAVTTDGKPVDLFSSEQAAPTPQQQQPKPAPETTPTTSSEGGLTLAAVGEQIIPTQEFVEGSFNTEGMTMAPPGSDVTDPEPPPPPFEANLSDLDMAEAGEQILDPNTPAAETRGATYSLNK